MIKWTRRFWMASTFGNLALWLPGCNKSGTNSDGLLVEKDHPSSDPEQRKEVEPPKDAAGSYAFVEQETAGAETIVAAKKNKTRPMSLASAIEKDQVVGQFMSPARHTHACLWERGKPRDLDQADSPWSSAWAVNGKGDVIGELRLEQDQSIQAFLWTKGTLTQLPGIGGNESHALSLNDAGLVAGYATNRLHQTHAVLWEDRKPRVLKTVEDGLPASQALALNDRGEAVGSCFGPKFGVAVRWKDGEHPEALPVPKTDAPNSPSSIAMAINRHGEIVGSRSDEKTRLPRACLWKQDKFHDIHGQGVSSTATSINASGHAVGTYTTDKGQTRAFLWDGKKMRDLTKMITDRRAFVISSAAMIDDRGWIVGTITWGKEQTYEACVLRPA